MPRREIKQKLWIIVRLRRWLKRHRAKTRFNQFRNATLK